ncbi:MAG: DNA polymerase III subunit alpha [Candidatus Omnitrophica bacterium]|nr:DNA polymerase III subunit alpha [Candidatus Omnitrophota bacterium]MDD5042362.1 DNA polymerase III subunit alpha [Candidatus Omnitrophota bacterium]MDD5500650.1 DNA polymerase III subunit alpha [Candidatus Omnitrophota bacterium]
MPHSDFIHLHLHTQYSLLDGACRIPEILSIAKNYKMDSLAITDHGNMFGAIEFYIEAQKAGIKPIIGCEVYVAPQSRHNKTSSGIEDAANHLILLARDETGYHNLMKLVSIGYLEGFYYRPRVDKEVLSQYSKGLIALSACLKGEIPGLLQQKRFNDALKASDTYQNIFGKGNFYLEMQANSIPEQKIVNEGLAKIARELAMPLVATNDVHYPTKDRAAAHEALLCVQTQSTLDDPKHMRFQTDEFYFTSPEEMKKAFRDYPEAISNTLEIARRCNLELNFKQLHLPKFTPPDGKDKEAYLLELCEKGMEEKNLAGAQEAKDRLKHELKIIKDMGFISYFLIVCDFISHAKKLGIPVGPGRGSAAGSLVSFLLGITDLNPLKYGLLFERFLNPERMGMPDIDIDFCYERRQEIIDYVTGKYGRENVAQIITFGTMQARGVIRDVGRVMGLSYGDVDRIAKMIPAELDMTLKRALESEPELDNLYKNDPQITKLINTAMPLEGLNRHASVHAAGVIISDIPLENYTPLFKSGDDQVTTGYSMGMLEKIGLLKVDFLGLKTLTVISETLKIIKKTRNIDIDIESLPLDDPKTYQLLASSQTIGVFQVESSGMRDLLKKLMPERFEDLIALLALYRPGPIGSGMLDDFMKRKHGLTPIKYEHPRLEPILKETYGIMVYQEQIMQIASALAGFSLAQADILRKAMGKKIPEVMEKQRVNFVNGCLKNGIKVQTATKIFDLIEYFSGYGFNKSHSTAYALISYRTAYLKANYPVEFMTALLTSERDDTDKIVMYVNEAQQMGINVLPPDINESEVLFNVENPTSIRFGLLAVKNVGRGASESIVSSSRKSKFTSLQDLCSRIDLRLANRKVLESLIKCGALDSFKTSRASMFASLETTLDRAQKAQKEKSSGQLSFFDQPAKGGNGFARLSAAETVDCKEWPEPQLLAFEKDMLGFYVSGHPLARYAKQLKRFASCSTATLHEHKDQDTIKIVGLIAKIKQTLTRAKQEKMAILKLEDLDGAIEALVFPRAFSRISRYIMPNTIAHVRGTLNLTEDTPKLIVEDLFPFEEIYKLISAMSINLSGVKENIFESLKELLSEHRGNIPIYLRLDTPSKSRVQMVVGESLYVNPSESLINRLDELLGENRLSLVL